MELLETLLILAILIIVLLLMSWPISLPLLLIYIIKKNKKNQIFKSMNIKGKEQYTEITPDKLAGFDINDLSKLKVYLYDIYSKFENAYNTLDYNTMYNVCTEKMYNLYHSSIQLDLKFDEKKIIELQKLENMIVYDTYTSKYKQVVYTVITVSYINYTIKSDGSIVSGNPTKPVKESFEVLFVKQFKQDDKYRCPSCGASVQGAICDYCKTKIDITDDYRIDSIKKIVK